ncbi:hypothetical protein CPB86DRAFT_99493 [Serendipita vermifera]|nr:hypothetical protein CPB86DRAFT_99493 [Serendipita vermifera]
MATPDLSDLAWQLLVAFPVPITISYMIKSFASERTVWSLRINRDKHDCEFPKRWVLILGLPNPLQQPKQFTLIFRIRTGIFHHSLIFCWKGIIVPHCRVGELLFARLYASNFDVYIPSVSSPSGSRHVLKKGGRSDFLSESRHVLKTGGRSDFLSESRHVLKTGGRSDFLSKIGLLRTSETTDSRRNFFHTISVLSTLGSCA